MLNSSLCKSLTDRIQSAKIESDPWLYVYLNPAIPSDLAYDFVSCFDHVALTRCEQTHADKTYRFSTASLTFDSPVRDGLWRQGLEAFLSNAYRESLGMLTGLDLDINKAKVTFDLWEYKEGDWLSPHLDKPEKLLTQVIYLTESWRDGLGGRLLIQKDSDPASTVNQIAPRFCSATILVRSSSSWHAVEPIEPGSPPRRSMTITFWSKAP